MQYAMGWMPDKSVNPSVIYASHCQKGPDGQSNSREPTLEVAKYLAHARVNKVSSPW